MVGGDQSSDLHFKKASLGNKVNSFVGRYKKLQYLLNPSSDFGILFTAPLCLPRTRLEDGEQLSRKKKKKKPRRLPPELEQLRAGMLCRF